MCRVLAGLPDAAQGTMYVIASMDLPKSVCHLHVGQSSCSIGNACTDELVDRGLLKIAACRLGGCVLVFLSQRRQRQNSAVALLKEVLPNQALKPADLDAVHRLN